MKYLLLHYYFCLVEGSVISKPTVNGKDKGKYIGLYYPMYHAIFTASKEDLSSVIQYEDLPSSSSSKQKLPSFWVPALTPDAKPTEIKKPVSMYIIIMCIYRVLL